MSLRATLLITASFVACAPALSWDGFAEEAGDPKDAGSDRRASSTDGSKGDVAVIPDEMDGAAATDAPIGTPCAEDTPLVGSKVLGPVFDNVSARDVNAFPYVAPADATARCVRIHLGPTLGPVQVGVYDDVNNLPSHRLALATVTNAVGGWNAIPLDSPVAIKANGKLWLAVVATNIAIDVDIAIRKDCTGRRTHKQAGGALPSTFFPDGTDSYCEAAFYLTP